MWIVCSVWKMIFPSIWRSFQRLHKVDRNGMSYHINIILLNRRENVWFFLYSRNSTGVYRFPNFHIFKQFPFQIPYNLDHFFRFSITFSNSFLPFQFPYPSIFATCYPFPEIFTSFPFPQTVPTLPFIRPFVRLRRHISHQYLFLIQPMV
jgi:hypothetical protein